MRIVRVAGGCDVVASEEAVYGGGASGWGMAGNESGAALMMADVGEKGTRPAIAGGRFFVIIRRILYEATRGPGLERRIRAQDMN